MATKKGQNSKLPRLPPSVYKASGKTAPGGNHGKLRDYLNFKMTKLFSGIGKASRKKSISSCNKLPSVMLEKPLPNDGRSSSEDDMLSHQMNKISVTETEELPTETEKPSPEIGIQSQRVETSPVITEEISLKASDLGKEDKRAATPRTTPSNGERREFCENTSCATKYSFLLDQGVQLTDAAKELSDEKMNLLWEDIFKPLDFCSILHDRRKKLLSYSDIETNMQNLFSTL